MGGGAQKFLPSQTHIINKMTLGAKVGNEEISKLKVSFFSSNSAPR
jgi:hypothetical protein